METVNNLATSKEEKEEEASKKKKQVDDATGQKVFDPVDTSQHVLLTLFNEQREIILRCRLKQDTYSPSYEDPDHHKYVL